MRKVIAAINMTIDGFCDHTSAIADDETHDHYTNLIRNAGDLLYGRTVYQMMESYWPILIENPSGNKSSDDFAQAIDDVSKVVFSNTLNEVHWKNARLAKLNLFNEINKLKQEEGNPIFIGSPGLIAQATAKDLIDEYQICVHPIIAGEGLPLFKNIPELKLLQLTKTKTFNCGAVIL